MKKMLILGIGCVSLKYLAQALQPYGYRPVVLARLAQFSEQIQSHFEDLEVHDVDIGSSAAVLAYLHDHRVAFSDVVAITSLFDEQFPLVETLAAEFDWASPGHVVARLSQKNSVLSLIPEYSPPSVCFTSENLHCLDLSPLEAWGEKLVIKPALSSGGLGLGHLTGREQLHQHLTEHLAQSGLGAETEWILQQEVSGRLLSYEGYVDAGWVRRLGISSRSRIGFTEVASRYPADDSLSQAIIARGWDCIESLIRRGDYQYGYFHCEFIQTDTSVYLVDANIGRIGGATVLEQVALAHHICPHQLLAHVLLLPLLRSRCPLSPCANARLEPLKTLGIWYGLPVAGNLEQLRLAPVRGQHTQFAAEGSQVPGVGESDYAWVGMLSGLEEEVLLDIHGITLQTDKGVFQPAFSVD